MKVITRFAPSPTGYLHIGGARTALFNYLFAQHYKGKFLLRIEDTDKQRSTSEARDAIFSSLSWLGLTHDEDVVFQSKRSERHKEVALKLLEGKKAYLCFTSQEEIEKQRDLAFKNKEHFIFKSPWRDADSSTFPKDIKPVIRLKSPREGNIIIEDKLQGDIRVAMDHLDDMVLLRSDLTPTYMLAVVVDDHDMGITHIIRGDDHLTNAARQLLIYQALGWDPPIMVHIPLIYGQDGTKLSKRHGAPSVEEYKKLGYFPEAICNYLLRLGWGHGDEEIISMQRAIELFSIDGLGKAPARLNIDKLNFLNAHYLREKTDEELCSIIKEHVGDISDISYKNIKKAMNSIKTRSKLISELVEVSNIYNIDMPVEYSEEASMIINNCSTKLIQEVIENLLELRNPNKEDIQNLFKKMADKHAFKLAAFIEPIRALITGKTTSPSIFEIIEIIGVKETVKRLEDDIIK